MISLSHEILFRMEIQLSLKIFLDNPLTLQKLDTSSLDCIF